MSIMLNYSVKLLIRLRLTMTDVRYQAEYYTGYPQR